MDGRILITCLHPECVNPIARYRVGDRGEARPCPCGAPRAFAVSGVHFLDRMYRLAGEITDRPERLSVRLVERLAVNEHTQKTPVLRME